MSAKIFYVYKPGEVFAGHVVAATLEEATDKAAKLLSADPKDLKVVDTNKTKPKCCPRR